MPLRVSAWSRRAAGRVQREPKLVASLERGLALLSCFGGERLHLDRHELACRTGLPLATVESLVRTLAHCGFLQRDERQHTYTLGPAALTLAVVAPQSLHVRDVAAPLMEELAADLGVSVALGSRSRLSMVCIEVRNSTELISLNMEVGMELPIAASAIGRAYLSVCAESERQALIEQLCDQCTDPRGVIDRSLATYTELGVCSSFGEWHHDVNSVAVGVRAASGTAPLSLACGAPAARATPDYLLRKVRPRLLSVARRLERSLGAVRAIGTC